MGVIRKIERSLKRDGFLKMVVLCFRNLRVSRRTGPPSQFDTQYGLETDGLIQLSDLKIDSPTEIWGVAYSPTPPKIFERVMAVLPPPEHYSFVDLGSGKGRVVVMAARLPFKSVTGVEFSPDLCAVAEGNVARFEPHIVAKEVKIVCQDAALFEFPAGPLIAYCYFAFTREVMVRVLDRLLQRKDETIFVYYNAHYPELFTQFQVLHSEEGLCVWNLSKRVTETAAG